MHILVVDDSKPMRMIVRRTLRLAGYHVEVKEACSGAEALQALQSAPVDLILCDWNMPEMNGLELLQRLQQTGQKVEVWFCHVGVIGRHAKRGQGCGCAVSDHETICRGRFPNSLAADHWFVNSAN